MGKRSRRREQTPAPEAPPVDYAGADGAVLTLRTVMTAKTRTQYRAVIGGNVLSQEDAWQRAVEFLFERLVVRWTIAGVPTEGQRDLLLRFRAATPLERRFVRETLRAHCSEWFPDVDVA